MRWLNDEQIPAFPFLLFILVLRWFIPPSQEKDSVGFLAVLICAFRFVLGVSSPYRCWGGGSGQALTVPLGSPVQQVGGTDEKWGRSCSDIS